MAVKNTLRKIGSALLLRLAMLPLLALLLLSVIPAQAQVPNARVSKELYLKLTEDFFDEVMSMDAVVEPLAERQQMMIDFRRALSSPDANEYRFGADRSWTPYWPPRAEPLPALGGWNQSQSLHLREEFAPVKVPFVLKATDRHSIKDLRKYIEARLGHAATASIEQGLVIAEVLGGHEQSLPKYLQVSAADLYKIPSFYQSWGIAKWFVPADKTMDGRARLVYVVPPASEYLEHYQYMLSGLTGRQQVVVKSVSDSAAWKSSFSEAAERVVAALPRRPDYISLGYFMQWPQVLEANQQKYILAEQGEIQTDPSGVLFRRLVFKAMGSPASEKEITLLTLGHQKAIWGEASAELIGAFLKFRPRGVLFLGSAGSLTPKANVYDLSVPKEFRTAAGSVRIENMLQPLRGKHSALQGSKQTAAPTAKQTAPETAENGLAQITEAQKIDGVRVAFETVHGHTPSPAVQTESYLAKKLKAGEDTIDVEQGLVAKMIADFNLKDSAEIQFCAINLVTDKPMANLEADLDNIDLNKKSRARLAAVRLALEALTERSRQPMSCRQVLR